jgi:hypothetical protein
MGCGQCHQCGHQIRRVLDGEEYCVRCEDYQRPWSHGWVRSGYSTAADQIPRAARHRASPLSASPSAQPLACRKKHQPPNGRRSGCILNASRESKIEIPVHYSTLMTFLAHSTGPGGRSHALLDHLRAVAAAAAQRAAKFGAGEIAFWGGLWHDLGKFHPAFQSYVQNPTSGRGPDHSSVGAVLAAEIYDPLAFPIAGHHSGLPSLGGLKARLAEKRDADAIQSTLAITEAQISGSPDMNVGPLSRD